MNRLARFVLMAALVTLRPGTAPAQYLYLDANGDGVWTTADFLEVTGVPTAIDVWLTTDRNKDGSPTTCNSGDGPLTIRSYVVNLSATGGDVVYSNFQNRMDAFTVEAPAFASELGEMTVGRAAAGGAPLPPGRYRLFTVSITRVTRFPYVLPVLYGDLGSDPAGFGTECSGGDFDGFYKLGVDWFDVDGVSSGIVDDFNFPIISVPPSVSSVEGRFLSIPAFASDADAGDVVTLTETGAPASLTWVVAPGTNVHGELRGTLGFQEAGTYLIQWTATDQSVGVAQATTALSVADSIPIHAATAFTTGANRVTVLGSGKPYTCVQIQPASASYGIADVNLASLRMIYPVGSNSQIPADAEKTSLGDDRNSDGIQEVAACFRKEEIRALFTGLSVGWNTVTVELRGDLATGERFRATMSMAVKVAGAALAASVSPNPFNPSATVTFNTTRPGAVRVQMFDARGRLVKTIASEASLRAGYHGFRIDATTSTGSRLASGAYFVTIWSQVDGRDVKGVTIAK